MSTNSESGHATNMANLDELNSYVTGYGAIYNPANATIQLPALQTLAVDVKNAQDAADASLGAYRSAVDAREAAFIPLSNLATRIRNSLKSSGVTKIVFESADSIFKKIQGRRAKPKLTDEQKAALAAEGKEVREVSASQMGYDNRLENMNKLIELLLTIPEYAPNEEELKTETLQALLIDLDAKNKAVISASTKLSNDRLARNEVFYKEETGLYDVASNVKSYVKSVFGATSAQYKQVSRIKFTKPKK